MRQGLLSEPKASSGPAAMLLAVSRSPSSIPRRSPCPDRCHLPLASLSPSTLTKPQQHPRLHLNPDRCHLPLAFPSPSPHKTSTASTTPSTPGPIPPSSGVPLSIPTKKRHPADSTLPDTGNKTPVKQTYTMYNQHSPSAQLNYHQKVLSATQDRWPAL